MDAELVYKQVKVKVREFRRDLFTRSSRKVFIDSQWLFVRNKLQLLYQCVALSLQIVFF